ncbi:MAG: ATP-binding protein [Desulfobacteraceae bacterium]|nr:ATP-binding protein [Desulfobacteraceae bacterium]MDH3880143.1 ATP-binding protein [Desulfobacteraceae bacterium]
MKPTKYQNGDYYRSLTQKMILTIILVSVTPLILVSSTILYRFHVSYHEKVRAHLQELVLKHKQTIDNYLKEKLGDIRFLSETFCFDELKDASFLQDRLDMLQQSFGPVFVDLGVVNSQGLQVAYAGPFRLGKALYFEADWFKKAMKTRYFISDVFLGLRGLPHFIVAVKDNWMGDPWILRATIDFVAFNNFVTNIRIGETGFAYILNREGKFQTKPFFDITPRREPYRVFLKIKEDDPQKVHIVEKTDDSGKKIIYVAAFLKDGDWLLVYQQNHRDAYLDLYRTNIVAITIIVFGAFGIVFAALFLSKRMVSRIAMADHEKKMMNRQIVETGKLASVGKLAAGIAHEINNPVAIMVEEAGWIGDLLEEEEFHESENLNEFERALKQIKTQGHRCKEITHKLLSFARKTDSRTQETQVNDLVKELVALSEQRAKYSKITIDTNLEKNLPITYMAQSEMQQILLNLINNSIDAMDKKGGELTITTYSEGDGIGIKVSDNGPGIPEANLSRIFEPFFTTKPVGKGTGLGLSICYGIIQKMGGQIEVESVIDSGTTFHIRLPIQGPSEH